MNSRQRARIARQDQIRRAIRRAEFDAIMLAARDLHIDCNHAACAEKRVKLESEASRIARREISATVLVARTAESAVFHSTTTHAAKRRSSFKHRDRIDADEKR
jgi:hypothetical protein